MAVDVSVAVTAALGIAAPVGSVTVPRMLPVDCAEMRDTAPSDSSTAKPMYSSLRSFLFICSLSFKSFQEETFDDSWVDVCVFTYLRCFQPHGGWSMPFPIRLPAVYWILAWLIVANNRIAIAP
jgi:hypothetical protein